MSLIYTLGPENAFFRRCLKITHQTPLRLKNLVLGNTVFAKPARETVHYVTFIAAPTVDFIRHEKGGLFTGIENPYFKADFSEQGVCLSFEPALILKAGEGYTSEAQFMGVYRKSGIMLEDSGREFRYDANGSGYKPLDRANPTTCYDIHATMMHLLGIDHTQLTVRHNGIDRRLTDVHGQVIRGLVG